MCPGNSLLLWCRYPSGSFLIVLNTWTSVHSFESASKKYLPALKNIPSMSLSLWDFPVNFFPRLLLPTTHAHSPFPLLSMKSCISVELTGLSWREGSWSFPVCQPPRLVSNLLKDCVEWLVHMVGDQCGGVAPYHCGKAQSCVLPIAPTSIGSLLVNDVEALGLRHWSTRPVKVLPYCRCTCGCRRSSDLDSMRHLDMFSCFLCEMIGHVVEQWAYSRENMLWKWLCMAHPSVLQSFFLDSQPICCLLQSLLFSCLSPLSLPSVVSSLLPAGTSHSQKTPRL